MRHKKLKLITVLLLLGLGLTSLQSQTMYVKEINGTQTAYTLSNLRKMTFLGGNVTVQKTDNSTSVYALSGLRYLNFSNLTIDIAEQPIQLSNVNFSFYPNPVKDVLNIDLTNLENRGTISILTLDGKLLQEQKIDGVNIVSINLSQLPQGIYLCRFASTAKIKTIKIIKH